jgi:hypothetical protein
MRQLSFKHLIINNRLVHCHIFATKTPFSCSSPNPSSLDLLVPLLPQQLSQALSLSPTFCCIGYAGCTWYSRGKFSHTSFRSAFNCDNLHSKHIVLAHSQFGQHQYRFIIQGAHSSHLKKISRQTSLNLKKNLSPLKNLLLSKKSNLDTKTTTTTTNHQTNKHFLRRLRS